MIINWARRESMGKDYGEYSVTSREMIPLPIPCIVRKNNRMRRNDQTQTTKLRIVSTLAAQGLSAREASIKAGMNPDTLGKFLSGKTLSLRAVNLSALAQVLDV